MIIEIQCEKYDEMCHTARTMERFTSFQERRKKCIHAHFSLTSLSHFISRFGNLSIAPYSIAPFNHISVLYSLWLQPVSYPPSSNQTQTAKRRLRYPGPQVFSQARAASRGPAHLPLLSNHSTPFTFTRPLPPAAS